MTVHVHVCRKDRWRCPICGKKCHVHDYLSDESFWRGMGFGPIMVWLGARVPRGRCEEHGVSNARTEALNNKIKLLIRIAYGFRNIDTMTSLVMPFCSNIQIPWPSSNAQMAINKGLSARKAE